jgi:dihydropteroate synthase
MSAEITKFPSNYTLKVRDKLLLISKPLVMGIINSTPDSFYKGSRFQQLDIILSQVEKQISEGADLIDLGAYSSRPGAEHISEQEEIKRSVAVVQEIKKRFPTLLVSIDTFRANVADENLYAGADIINDISGGQIEPEIWKVCAKHQVPYVLMHMKGTPQTMLSQNSYSNLFQEVFHYFSQKINQLKETGVVDVIIDLGFGFAKDKEQNFELFSRMQDFSILNEPMLVGISRKSMIQKELGVTAEDALNGTTVLNSLALQQGASILRVHDVKEAVEAVKLVTKLKEFN